ncbi:Protein of unknown function [Pyronema omphalodes CBS 100304]|uniref:Uncharacterized protein n=1 Tax=Pyronema omphalodes (strain CBS 100304) TaxID=1076935 RepID=U4LC90_PYROM|nr:Protein of unknown function [Pyronema omphalodes CBS 100304]
MDFNVRSELDCCYPHVFYQLWP